MSTAKRKSHRRATGIRRESGASGFSLVEMLIGIVITGVVGAAVVGVLIEQNTFYEENSRMVTAQKSLRSATDQMSTELRMVRRGDVQTADTDRLVVTFNVAHGVVCHESGGTSYLYFHNLPESTPPEVRYLEPRFNGSWQDLGSWPSQDGSQECASHGAPAGRPADHYRQVGANLEVGTIVTGTTTLTYEFEPRSGEIVLLRNGDRLTGPFEQDAPYFRYLDKDENTTGNLDEIAYVEVRATALGHDPNARYEGSRSIDLRIPFRN